MGRSHVTGVIDGRNVHHVIYHLTHVSDVPIVHHVTDHLTHVMVVIGGPIARQKTENGRIVGLDGHVTTGRKEGVRDGHVMIRRMVTPDGHVMMRDAPDGLVMTVHVNGESEVGGKDLETGHVSGVLSHVSVVVSHVSRPSLKAQPTRTLIWSIPWLLTLPIRVSDSRTIHTVTQLH